MSPAYLNPGACRRRYEAAVQREETYPTRALEALVDRLLAAANAARGEIAVALRDRADVLARIVAGRHWRAERELLADLDDAAACAREDAWDAEREWEGRR